MRFTSLFGIGLTGAIMLMMVFALGATAGASAAQNETGGAAAVDNATAELEDLPATLRQDLEANTSGVYQRVVVPPAVQWSRGAAMVGIAGIRLGYEHPILGRLVGWGGVLGAFGGVGIMLWQHLRHAVRALGGRH
jgi:hypothetical protein